ncbi:hypothetical protein XJ32_06805 [Helicobacter bilis]|uniref:Uncharacterized protein n=1 Tax=Helicobacter bilis TaxID=37372 RepID=A0A1Q2LHI8_9HELI|nr:hypothetical protein XJ32_06805 [Helicobacter bilis]
MFFGSMGRGVQVSILLKRGSLIIMQSMTFYFPSLCFMCYQEFSIIRFLTHKSSNFSSKNM